MVPSPARALSTALAVFVDVMEWVELANALGLSQYVDGDLMTSKSNIACGRRSQCVGGPCARNPRVAPLNNAERQAI